VRFSASKSSYSHQDDTSHPFCGILAVRRAPREGVHKTKVQRGAARALNVLPAPPRL
jgi:hypothetical protein